jgi:lambda family phage portal protein
MARSWLRDGDVFGQQLMGPVAMLDHGTVLPYSLEALEADFVPLDLNDQKRSIVQGVEVNAWGRPRAYWVYKGHPGDALSYNVNIKRTPSDRMFHLKLVKRLHQTRGISIFASAISRMDDIKEIDESERVAARVAAAMAGYIKKGTPDLFQPNLDADGNVEQRAMEFVPGMIFDDLMPGEEIGTINPNRPNTALIAFRDSQLRSAASGLMTGYSSLSKNYSGTYSAQRQELVEQFVNYRTLTGTFAMRFCQRVWDGFVDSVRLSGALRIDRNIDQATLFNVSHTAPPMPWVDPVKEMQANEIAENRGWKSRPSIIRERGANPDKVNREILKDQQERERLGLDLSAAQTSAPAADPDAEPAVDPDANPDDDTQTQQTADDGVAAFRPSRKINGRFDK